MTSIEPPPVRPRLGLFDRRPRPPEPGADITQVIAFVDRYLEQQHRNAPPGARLRAAAALACQRTWDFLKAVGETRAREEMLALARSIAASRPELAARLRRAAREAW